MSSITELVDLLEAYALTPDGGIADPNHPIYIVLYVLKTVVGA